MQNRKDGYRNFREKNELGVKKEDFCWKHRNPLKLMTLAVNCNMHRYWRMGNGCQTLQRSWKASIINLS